MDAILAPLERVHDALSWFDAASEQRVLYLQTSAALRMPILQRLAAGEGQGRRRSPVVVLEAGVDEDDDGWATRADELIEELGAARGRAASAEPPLVIGSFAVPAAGATPVASFARVLWTALTCVAPPLEGLLVVLAPVWVNDAAAWVATLHPLLTRPELAAARWVIVDPEDGPARAVAEALGPLAEVCDARIDPAASARDLAAMLSGMGAAPPGSSAARAAGMAGPREAPPRRIRQPPAPTPAQQAELMASVGLPAAFADADLMQRIRVGVLNAAEAMQAARAVDAVRLQREVRDLAAQAGLVRESVLFEIVLGTYALQGGAPAPALTAFDEAARRAVAASLPELAAQALLAKAGALLLARRPADAALAYAEAGRLAREKAPVLAIEAYRMAGTLLLQLRQDQQAIAVWQQALDLAGASAPAVRAASTAAEVARALAAVCRGHGLRTQADALVKQAEALEQPPEGVQAGEAEGGGAGDGSVGAA